MINGFNHGGAEQGLLTLIRDGFFDGHELVVFGLCRGNGALYDDIAASLPSGRLRLVTKSTSLSFGALIRGVATIVRAVRRERPAMVVLSLKQANIVGRLALLFAPSVRCVSYEHTATYRARRWLGVQSLLLRLLSLRVDEIWADCDETLERSRRYFLRQVKRSHIVSMFGAGAGYPRKSGYAANTPFRLVAAGRLISLKNFALLIETIDSLKGTLDLSLDLFGEGEERSSLESLIARLGLSHSARLHGHVPEWFRQQAALTADAFVNLSDTEGFCIVVAEAMAIGLPVIATDVGGIRDYGRHRENMLKLTRPEQRLLLAALIELAGNESLRRQMGSAARLDMLAHYNPASTRVRGAEVLGTDRALY